MYLTGNSFLKGTVGADFKSCLFRPVQWCLRMEQDTVNERLLLYSMGLPKVVGCQYYVAASALRELSTLARGKKLKENKNILQL